jgi:hypothetical protein
LNDVKQKRLYISFLVVKKHHIKESNFGIVGRGEISGLVPKYVIISELVD